MKDIIVDLLWRQLRVSLRMSGIQTALLTTLCYLQRSANLCLVFPLRLSSWPQTPLCHSYLRTCGFLFGHNILWLWHERWNQEGCTQRLKAWLLFFFSRSLRWTTKDVTSRRWLKFGWRRIACFSTSCRVGVLVLKKCFCAYLLMLDSPKARRRSWESEAAHWT